MLDKHTEAKGSAIHAFLTDLSEILLISSFIKVATQSKQPSLSSDIPSEGKIVETIQLTRSEYVSAVPSNVKHFVTIWK